MIPFYEERKEKLCFFQKVSRHVPPHLHHAMEFVYVTEGTLEFGMAQKLYHMETGDFAIAFQDMIHHYQVFSKGTSKAYYLLALPSLSGQYQTDLQKYCPENPVISKEHVHPEIRNAFESLGREEEHNSVIGQAYMQIILARSMPCFHLVERSSLESEDIIYQTVSYMAGHFKEELSLEGMAKALGVSKYVLSRVFSATFHSNFNQYLNEHRLNYASTLLECTNRRITDICMDAGFQSQRTFNRAFQERYRMTPRTFRNICRINGKEEEKWQSS